MPAPADVAGRTRFVTSILGAGEPALIADLQSVFSLSLTESGAAFMASMFEATGMPVAVSYTLGFEGLAPAVKAKVTADISRLRRRFGGGLQGQVQWFKADISAAIDELVAANEVRVESTVFTTDDAAREAEQRAIALFKEDIIQQLFRPTGPAAPQPQPGQSIADLIRAATQAGTTATGDATAAATGASLGLTLKFEHETQHLSGIYVYDNRAPTTRTDAPQAFLQTLIEPEDHAEHTTVVDLGAATFFDRVDTLVSAPDEAVYAQLNLAQAIVSITFGAPDDGRPPEQANPVVCQPGVERTRTVSFVRAGRPSLAITYDIAYEFADPVGATVDATSYRTEPRSSATRAISVNPTGDFGYREFTLALGRLAEDIREIDVDVGFRLEDEDFAPHRQFRFRAPFDRPIEQVAGERPVWPIRTRSRSPGAYELRETYVFADGTEWQRPPRSFEGSAMTLDDPFEGIRELMIQPNVVSPKIEMIQAEVEYEDAANDYRRRFVVDLVPPFAMQRLKFPLVDADRRTVRLRATVIEEGLKSTGEWEDIEDVVKTVGAEAVRVVDLDVRLIGGDAGGRSASTRCSSMSAARMRRVSHGCRPSSSDRASRWCRRCGWSARRAGS